MEWKKNVNVDSYDVEQQHTADAPLEDNSSEDDEPPSSQLSDDDRNKGDGDCFDLMTAESNDSSDCGSQLMRVKDAKAEDEDGHSQVETIRHHDSR